MSRLHLSEPDESVDWQRLALDLDLIKVSESGGWTELGGGQVAREALVRILGPSRIAGAVEHAISMQPGFELARSVLRLLRPVAAMEHCRSTFASTAPVERRRGAVELLRVVADRRVLSWIPDFLRDPDPDIQTFGIGIVRELSFSETLERQAVAPILAVARLHQNERVREVSREIEERLCDEPGFL